MLTLADAIEAVRSGDTWQRHQGIIDEALDDAMILRSLMAMRDEAEGGESGRLMRAFVLGLCIGIEMEKGER